MVIPRKTSTLKVSLVTVGGRRLPLGILSTCEMDLWARQTSFALPSFVMDATHSG
jgi:hypothetical protein